MNCCNHAELMEKQVIERGLKQGHKLTIVRRSEHQIIVRVEPKGLKPFVMVMSHISKPGGDCEWFVNNFDAK